MVILNNKQLLTIIFCSLLVLSISTISYAEESYCSGAIVLSTAAEVEGPKNSPINSVKLQNSRTDCGNWAQGESMWFTLNKGNANSMLATALSAQISEYSVTITTESGNSYSDGDTLVLISVDSP
jgi:hypothetical protein